MATRRGCGGTLAGSGPCCAPDWDAWSACLGSGTCNRSAAPSCSKTVHCLFFYQNWQNYKQNPAPVALFHTQESRGLLCSCERRVRFSPLGISGLADGVPYSRPPGAAWHGPCHSSVIWLSPWGRSEEHTSELQSLMRISYAVFCLKKNNKNYNNSY